MRQPIVDRQARGVAWGRRHAVVREIKTTPVDRPNRHANLSEMSPGYHLIDGAITVDWRQ
jgi:hypothetical protein